MDLIYHTLQNGIRLVHLHTKTAVAHCGIIINAGSRDEDISEHGMAHFIEHMLFKGTSKRKSYHILSCLEDVGGELNAYTTKEDTAVHASFLKEDFDRAIELMTDILFNSGFPEKEIEKEKDVILEEINSYLDNPSELIFDEFEEIIFGDQPIGRSILGTPSSVRNVTQKSLKGFIKKNYDPGQIVFCSVGDISTEKVLKLFTRYFSDYSSDCHRLRSKINLNYKTSNSSRKKDTYQNHCMIGNVAYSYHDTKRHGMFLLNNILGGHGLNSRLNLSLREKYGYAYSVESNFSPFSDTGIFSIYFGTDNQYLNKSISIVEKELQTLRTKKLGIIQLSRAKRQVKGYIARGNENHESLMLGLGKSLLAFNRVYSTEELFSLIDRVTASELLDIANEIFEPAQLSTLIYK